MIIPAHVPSTGILLGDLPQRLGESLALHPQGHDGRFAPRDDQRVQALQVGRHADLERPGSQ